MEISVAVEGLSDRGVVSAIVRTCGLSVTHLYGGHGKSALLKSSPAIMRLQNILLG